MADLFNGAGTGAELATGGKSPLTCAWPLVFDEVDVEADGVGGRVENDSSGSRRARLAAGGEVGGDLMGEAISGEGVWRSPV